MSFDYSGIRMNIILTLCLVAVAVVILTVTVVTLLFIEDLLWSGD